MDANTAPFNRLSVLIVRGGGKLSLDYLLVRNK
jgi:hypothetical protein